MDLDAAEKTMGAERDLCNLTLHIPLRKLPFNRMATSCKSSESPLPELPA